MLERVRRSGRLPILAIVLVVGIAVVALVVRGVKLLDRDDPPDPCRSPRAAPPAETALMPAGLSFDEIGTVTGVTTGERTVTVEAITTKPLDEATVLIQDAVTDAGYRPAGIDNEGIEAEVFFTTSSFAAGQARVRPSACGGRWDIELVLLDRNARSSPGS
jgi:hypothetical protein